MCIQSYENVPITENLDTLVLQSCPQGAGKSCSGEKTFLCLRDRVSARLSWVSEQWKNGLLSCLSFVDALLLNRTLFFCPFLPRQQMAKALRELNVPVTVVLDAAIG